MNMATGRGTGLRRVPEMAFRNASEPLQDLDLKRYPLHADLFSGSIPY